MAWIYDIATDTWKQTIGEWQALVQRVADGTRWCGIIEHTGSQPERYQSLDFQSASTARIWCEIEITKRLLSE
jgi:hypothetical protein